MDMPKDPSQKYFQKLRKWTPGIALGFLTIVLMIVFKNKQGTISTIIDQGKNQLIKFYTENLNPLVSETSISREDVFNFALYRNLPVNKNREKILKIDADEKGDEYFEIVPATVKKETQNYNKFVQMMDLNTQEIDSLDRLLDSYKYPIYSSVLVKDNETMAVDPNIINLHRALFADLVRYAQSIDKSKSEKIIPVDYSFVGNQQVASLIENVKKTNPAEYVFYSQDTVFNLKCQLDKEKLYTNIKDIEETGQSSKRMKHFDYAFNFPKTTRRDKEKFDSTFNYVWSDNAVKVFPTLNFEKMVVKPELQTLNEELGKLSLQLTSEMIELAKVSGELASIMALEQIKNNVKIDSVQKFNFEFNVEDFENHWKENAKVWENQDWEAFGKRMGAVALKFAEHYSDSLSVKESDKFKKEMQSLKEQLKTISEEVKESRRLNKPKRK